jgi:hypothetical protein
MRLRYKVGDKTLKGLQVRWPVRNPLSVNPEIKVKLSALLTRKVPDSQQEK